MLIKKLVCLCRGEAEEEEHLKRFHCWFEIVVISCCVRIIKIHPLFNVMGWVVEWVIKYHWWKKWKLQIQNNMMMMAKKWWWKKRNIAAGLFFLLLLLILLLHSPRIYNTLIHIVSHGCSLAEERYSITWPWTIGRSNTLHSFQYFWW